jgi:TolB protein
MRADGTDERLLTSSYLDEGPTWAPNGRVLMFSREAPRQCSQVVERRRHRTYSSRPPYPRSGSDPAWSPLLN